MILAITKDQEGKLFGGVKFVIKFKAMLSPEETALINRYKVGDVVLLHAKKKLITEYEVNLTVNKLAKGDKFVAESIEILHDYEEELIKSCRELISLLEELKSFGGEYFLDISPDSITAISREEAEIIIKK